MPSTPTSSLLVETPAVELRRLIGARQLSPVELLDACIARIEALNPFVNAVTATCFERAREEAIKAEQAVMRGDALGLLHGLPLGVKDLEPTAGLLSTSGSPPLRNHVPSRDIELVDALDLRNDALADRRLQTPDIDFVRHHEVAAALVAAVVDQVCLAVDVAHEAR